MVDTGVFSPQTPKLLLITVASETEARDLALLLVNSGLAACVNIIPGIQSIYQWQGALCEDKELLLVVKTEAVQIQPIADLLSEHHSYTCPELISLPIAEGSQAYLDWLLSHSQGPAH
ncbi:MAG: divalent-cation tolerance protein CutA [Cyanobacteria bacterium]|nr:divalent-cation tolerance protein CutA [Cyanobacteriota bacterium]